MMMKILEKLNPNVAGITPYEPGRPIEEVARELNLDPAEIIKLASNENALGPSPKAVAAMREALPTCHRYPDGGAYLLRGKLAEKYGFEREHVLVGNGSNEILELAGHCFLHSGAAAVFSQYSFVVYRLVSMLCGARMREVPATAGLGHDLAAMREAVSPDTAVVFLCNPNNPTGTMFEPAAVETFMDGLPEDVLVIFDEAYAEIALEAMPDTLRYVREGRPVLVTRTFSKAYGLAGLRLGYAFGAPPLVRALNQARQPFNCNLLAQIGGAAALADDDFVAASRKLCREGRDYLEGVCRELDLEYVPGGANFMLIKVGDGARVFAELQPRGVIVRPMAGYQLPEYIRVTYGTMAENKRFAAGLAEVLGE